ncbi:MAG: alpha/beta hydrolase [Leptospiraceae bacterium]|nr:alpha/beta hydrolase [Leptospiraceae bacterium]
MKKFGFILFLCLLQSCATNTNREYLVAKNLNTVEGYETFIKNYPKAPQVLTAKLQLEKLMGLKRQPSPFKWNSETSINVSRDGEKFKDSNGNLKPIFDFYKSKSKRDSFIGVDGFKITYDYFLVSGAKQALVISHGTGESSIRYAELVYDLLQNKLPYSIFIINHRGHGYSQRLLGKYKEWNPNWDVYNVMQEDILEYRKIYVNQFDDYVADFSALVQLIKQKHGFEKVTALGHSLGGGVVARYAELNPTSFDKMILSAPLISVIGILGADNSDYLSKSIISVGDTFSHKGYAIGSKNFNHFVTTYESEDNTINPYTTSYNRFFMKKYIIQEFPDTSLGGLSWGFTNAIYDGVKDIRKDAGNIKIPTLIFQTEHDAYVHPSGQNTVCDAINKSVANQCQLKVVKSSNHEIFLERDLIRDQVMNDVMEFLVK